MRLITILILIFISQFCFGQNSFTLNNGGTTQTNYYSTLQYEKAHEKIILNAKIKGKTYTFILDTGAPTTISTELLEELKPSIITKISVSDANQSNDSMTVVSLDEIILGDIVFKDIPTLVAKPNVLFDCFQVDGFIGSNLLRNSILQIDESNRKVIITDDVKSLNLNPKQSSKMFLNSQSSPFIWVQLKNKKTAKEQLLFDSGMEGLYDLSLHHLEIFQKHNIFEELGKGIGSNLFGLHGIGKDTAIFRLRLPIMEINGSNLLNITTETTLSSNSRIGASLLQYGVVTVDYKNKKFYFNPYTQNDINVSTKEFGISFIPKDNKLFINIIWDSDLTKQINVGDQIIEIDGINCEHINICDLLVKRPFSKKDKIRLTIKNSVGSIVETTIERK